MAEECFHNKLQVCIDKTPVELNDDFKSYSVLTVAQGKIWFTPGKKRNIIAFLQWTKDMYHSGQDLATDPFSIDDVTNIIRRQKMHQAFIDKTKTITDTATPAQFTSKIKWINWYPTFIKISYVPFQAGMVYH